MTVLDILASTKIHSLARGCVFSYRLSHLVCVWVRVCTLDKNTVHFSAHEENAQQ